MLCRGALRDACRRTPTPVAAQGVLLLGCVSANFFGSLHTDGLSAGQRMVFKDWVKISAVVPRASDVRAIVKKCCALRLSPTP